MSAQLEGMRLETGQLGWKVVSKYPRPKKVMVERMKLKGQV